MSELNKPYKQKILFTIGSLDIGGAERHLAQLAPRLTAAGWEVCIFCITDAGAQADDLRSYGVEVLTPPYKTLRRARWRTVRRLHVIAALVALTVHLLRTRPAIAHFFLPYSYVLGGIAALAAGVPVRIMSRRSLQDYQRERPWMAKLERWLHPRMTAILANSRQVAAELIESEGCPPAKVGIVYNGVDNGAFAAPHRRAAIRKTLGITDSALVMIIVANLIPYKGHSDLLSGLGRIGPNLPEDWTLLCVGRDDGPLCALQKQAQASNIGPHVRFLGVRRDIADLLSAADLAILCSHQEGFANAIIEAMAAGLPAVVTDVGGNAEAVRDGIDGLVVPPHEPAALGAAILRLSCDRDQRTRMGRSAAQRAKEHFSFERCVENYERVYRELADGGPLANVAGVTALDFGFPEIKSTHGGRRPTGRRAPA
jgi:glycosyltransferase involved in cell wall biosynthesis